MKRCPKCNRLMRQVIEYKVSGPYVHYVCACGFDTGKIKIIQDVRTANHQDKKGDHYE